MTKTLSKEWVKFLLGKCSEIEVYLIKTNDLNCRLALIDLRSMRDVLMNHAVSDVEVEMLPKDAVNEP